MSSSEDVNVKKKFVNTSDVVLDKVAAEAGTVNEMVVFNKAVMAMPNNRSLDPPTFISENKTSASYKKDLRMWSRIISIPKISQAEVVVYGLEGHPTGIKEKIILNIGESLEEAENGIDLVLTFLDTIYQEDDMSAAWTKYKSFKKITRPDGVRI